MPIRFVSTEDIRSFCLREHLTLASKKNYLAHLKAFFNWVAEKEFRADNPCDGIRLPKTRDNLVEKIIDRQQLHELYKAFRDYQHAQAETNRQAPIKLAGRGFLSV